MEMQEQKIDRPLIVVVDEDLFFQRFYRDVLSKAGMEVTIASGGQEALELCKTLPVSLVIVDMYMPGMSGIQILEELKARHPGIDVVVATGYASVDTAVQALKKGASDYLRKPFAPEELSASVGGILEQRRLYQVNEDLKNQLRLYELSRSFAAVEDNARVAELALETFLELTGATSGIFAGKNLESLSLEVITARGDFKAKTLGKAFPDKGDVFSQDAPFELDPEKATKLLAGILPPTAARTLVIPQKNGDTTIGAFIVARARGEGEFTERQLKNAEFISAQVSLAFRSVARLQEAKSLAFVDPLTDLYNSRYLPIILEQRIKEASEAKRPVSLLFLDLDHFRNINTDFGHQAGSKALLEVAWILTNNVRSGDTVIRFGGDEFTIVLPNADSDRAREIAERILATIRGHEFLGRENKKVALTACIGVATFPTDAKTSESLIYLADQAMYRGKNTTRDRVVLARTEAS